MFKHQNAKTLQRFNADFNAGIPASPIRRVGDLVTGYKLPQIDSYPVGLGHDSVGLGHTDSAGLGFSRGVGSRYY